MFQPFLSNTAEGRSRVRAGPFCGSIREGKKEEKEEEEEQQQQQQQQQQINVGFVGNR